MAESLEARVKKDPKLLARVLKNPGLRSKLPAKYLSKSQQAKRKTNVRLNAPIVAGSPITERALANESQAAMDVKYGPRELAEKQTLGEEKTRQRDTTGFYDQYLAQVAQHAKNVQGIGATAAQTGLGLQQGITGLAGASLTGLQNPATADAAARGAQAGDLSGMASNAAAIRQALVGSFVAQQAGRSAAAGGYADTQAHVVAPGQKLAAQAMGQGRIREAGEKIQATATERGQDDVAFRAGRRADEGKNILAMKIAGANEADKLADNTLGTKTLTETTRSNKADEKETAKQRRADERKAKRDQDKADAEALAKGHEPNKYGVPADQWAKWSTTHRQREIDKFDKATGKKPKVLTPQQQYDQDFFKKYGVKPATTPKINSAKATIGEAKAWLKKLGGNPGDILTTGGKVDVEGSKDKLDVPKLEAIFVRVAMDLANPGYISASTANRLHQAGYSVKTLGLPSTAPKAKPPGGILGSIGGAADRVAGSVK